MQLEFNKKEKVHIRSIIIFKSKYMIGKIYPAKILKRSVLQWKII